jgi:hypothetical protein
LFAASGDAVSVPPFTMSPSPSRTSSPPATWEGFVAAAGEREDDEEDKEVEDGFVASS